MTWNVGLIGLDGHQGQILEGIVGRPDIRLAAVTGAPERTERIKGHPSVSGDTVLYEDYRRMLDEAELQVVGICNVDGDRAPILSACADAGMHIVSEKPLVTTLEDLATVRAAIERSGVTLTMLLTMRFEAAYWTAKKLVERGAIGEPILASAQKSYRLGERPGWMKSRSSFGGTIPFVGIHALDLIRWVTGREFTKGTAYHGNVGNPQIDEMEDNASILAKLDNGGSASAHLDYLRPMAAPSHGDDALRVAGTEGVLEVRYGKTTLLDAEGGPREVPLSDPGQFFVDFIESLEGERQHLISAEDAYRMTEICLKLRDSADTGAPTKL